MLEIQPNNAEALKDIISFYREKGQFDLAKQCEIKSMQLDPLNARYPREFGLGYSERGDYVTAEKYLKKAIELSPNTSGYYVDLSDIYLDWKGDTKLAWQTVTNIKNDEYLEASANIFIDLNILDRKFDEALKKLKSSPKEYLDMASGYRSNSQMIALIYRYMENNNLSKGYFDSSKIKLEKMIRHNPDDFRLPLSLSISYAGLNEKEKALNKLKKGIKLLDWYFDKNWISKTQKLYLTQIYILVGEYDNALKQIDYLLSNPSGFSVNILKLDPLYDPLKNLKSYKEIIKKYSIED